MIAPQEQAAPQIRDGIATMKEAMRFLSRSRSHIETLIEDGKIDGVKDGRLWAIDWLSLYAHKRRIFEKRKRA